MYARRSGGAWGGAMTTPFEPGVGWPGVRDNAMHEGAMHEGAMHAT